MGDSEIDDTNHRFFLSNTQIDTPVPYMKAAVSWGIW